MQVFGTGEWWGRSRPSFNGPVPSKTGAANHRALRIEFLQSECDCDLEGIVAKLADGLYRPEAPTWVKIKNRHYSQAEGRAGFFKGRTFSAR